MSFILTFVVLELNRFILPLSVASPLKICFCSFIEINVILIQLFPYRFDVHHVCFFTPAIRSRIVQFILDRKRFTKIVDDDYAFGIDRLIDEGVYIAAYPLHDVSLYILILKKWETKLIKLKLIEKPFQ